MNNKIKQYIEERFGRLRIVEEIEPYYYPCGQKQRMFLCVCDCGKKVKVRLGSLKDGNTQSCGCFRKSQALKANTTHGYTHTSEYDIWKSMKKRCLLPNNKAYKYYGARGITMCNDWVDSFQNFIKDMGERPSPQHSIDRIDNNKGYSKENCRWATPEEQANNTRSNYLISHKGKTQSISMWAREIGINYMTLYSRIRKQNWDINKALSK